MATNSLDAVLAQYEQSKQGSSSSTSKFTQEERMKKLLVALMVILSTGAMAQQKIGHVNYKKNYKIKPHTVLKKRIRG